MSNLAGANNGSAELRQSASLHDRGAWYVGAELGCLALGLTLAMSSLRLFSEVGDALTLSLVATVAWALAIALRRSPLPGWAADSVHLLLGIAALLVIVAPAQRWGLLPTPDSILQLVDVLRADFGSFEQDIAPMVPRTGHMVTLAALIWVLALFCSTAAMRLRSPVQGAAPHVVVTIGLGFLARSSWRYGTAALLVGAVAIYALSQIAWRNANDRWVPATRSVPAARFGAGAALALTGILAAALLVPLLPVAVDPVLDVRRGGLGDSGPRTVVSPFVEVGANLDERSDDLLFTMKATTPQYWRLTALDTYDAENAIWVLSNRYEAVSGPLEPGVPTERPVDLDVRSLGGIWIPSPADPVLAESDFELNWDSRSESLIKRSGNLTQGDAVDFRVAPVRIPDPSELVGAQPGTIDGATTDTEGVPRALWNLTAQLAPDRSPYQSLLALQNHFRDTFTYDETVDYSEADDPLNAFLTAQSGFCQQFSTAFALGARALGFPARVVVGFTPGDSDPTSDPDEMRTFAVSGRHAHAWPEVYFDGIGWVPYEPTPGRGNPAATAVTGVAAAQAAPPSGTTGLEEVTPQSTSTVAPAPTTTAVDPTTPEDATEEVTADGDTDSGSNEGESASWIFVLLAALAVGVVSVLVLRRKRSSKRPIQDSDEVHRAWLSTLAQLEPLDLQISDSETPIEFARRCNNKLSIPELFDLAALESARRWSGRPTTEDDERAARTAAEAIEQVLQLATDPAVVGSPG